MAQAVFVLAVRLDLSLHGRGGPGPQPLADIGSVQDGAHLAAPDAAPGADRGLPAPITAAVLVSEAVVEGDGRGRAAGRCGIVSAKGGLHMSGKGRVSLGLVSEVPLPKQLDGVDPGVFVALGHAAQDFARQRVDDFAVMALRFRFSAGNGGLGDGPDLRSDLPGAHILVPQASLFHHVFGEAFDVPVDELIEPLGDLGDRIARVGRQRALQGCMPGGRGNLHALIDRLGRDIAHLAGSEGDGLDGSWGPVGFVCLALDLRGAQAGVPGDIA